MKNKTVKLILAVAVLGVLTGGYFGVKSYVASQEKAEEEKEEEKTNVFETETDGITSMKFLIDEKEVTFLKEDDTWKLDDEKEFPVDQDTLDSAASYISSVDAERVLENVEDLSEYGLDVPKNTITVSSDDGSETVLRIGMKNDSTSQYYVSKDDDRETVYVVAESLIDPFMKSLYDYAEMQTFPDIDASTISKVSVDQKENSYEAVKNENSGLWSIVSDGESEKADSAKLSSLTSSLASMEYDDFVDYNCTDEDKYGLDEPYATIIVDYEEETEEENKEENKKENEEDGIKADIEADMDSDAELSEEETEESGSGDEDGDIDDQVSEDSEPEMIAKQLMIKVGDVSDSDSDSRYVMVDGSNEVYTMTNDLLSTVIDKDVSAMWDMTVNYISLNDLDSLDVELDGEKNTIDVSRETLVVNDEESEEVTDDSEDKEEDPSSDDEENADTDSSSDEPETETVVTYEVNGEKVEDIAFTTFYNKLINLSGQKRLTEEYDPDEKPEMQVVFHKLDSSSINVDFYEYDVNYYAAVVDKKVYLLNKMTFKELRNSYEELISEDSDLDADEENSGSVEGDTGENMKDE